MAQLLHARCIGRKYLRHVPHWWHRSPRVPNRKRKHCCAKTIEAAALPWQADAALSRRCSPNNAPPPRNCSRRHSAAASDELPGKGRSGKHGAVASRLREEKNLLTRPKESAALTDLGWLHSSPRETDARELWRALGGAFFSPSHCDSRPHNQDQHSPCPIRSLCPGIHA